MACDKSHRVGHIEIVGSIRLQFALPVGIPSYVSYIGTYSSIQSISLGKTSNSPCFKISRTFRYRSITGFGIGLWYLNRRKIYSSACSCYKFDGNCGIGCEKLERGWLRGLGYSTIDSTNGLDSRRKPGSWTGRNTGRIPSDIQFHHS